MGGSLQASLWRMDSRTASTQPTVPSPPHTSTRNCTTCWKVWSLHAERKNALIHKLKLTLYFCFQ